MRRPSPLYLLAAILAVAVGGCGVATVGTAPTSSERTGSVYDDGPGGAAALRRYLAAMGASTTTVQGDRFVPDPSALVLFILGATEGRTPADADNVKKFVPAGGTAVVATELGLFERPLLDAFDVRLSGLASPGTHALA